MSAHAAHAASDDELRLWSSSVLAALAAHVAFALLLFAHWDWREPVPAGSPSGTLDVELASLAAPAPLARLPPSPSQPVPSPLQFKPLAEVPELSSQMPPPAEPPARPPPVAAQTPLLAQAELAASPTPPGESDAPENAGDLWAAQVNSRLKRYVLYPRGAIKQHQQDTVLLQFSVDRTGRVSYYRIDSKHQYVDLEQEVLHALRLAAPFPPPPAGVPADTVLRVPVAFSLKSAGLSAQATVCPLPAAPGPVPSGAVATLRQMLDYQQRLNPYVSAVRGCTASNRATLVAQANTLVRQFNAQARLFQATAQAQALKVRQQAEQAAAARLAQAQAAAATAYAACPAPADRGRPPANISLTAANLQTYRKRLVAYDAAVHAYVSCIDQAQRTVLAQAGAGLTAAQRAQIARGAASAGNAAILPLNQLVAAFNTQLQHLQQQASAERAQIAAWTAQAAARAAARAALIAGTWDMPAPLPQGECLRIERDARGYHARLCNNIYMTPTLASAHNALTSMIVSGSQSVSYAIANLQVAGVHVAFTIERYSETQEPPTAADDWASAAFDLTLSADGQSLVGQCSTQQMRRKCQLSRQR